MELVAFAQEAVQSIAEHAASYKIGQIALRQLDRALWVVEKCARWAVPPPLDQDERPQPELVRPLPWVFFLMMLITLRVTRESISIFNLIVGKPPLRSADVVMYIQSKRRYLRTLKYQGNRIARARSSNAQPRDSWYSSVRSLFEFTMCFRKAPMHYGNNNTTSVSNNDEVLVVKRGKPERDSTSPVTSTNAESTMERLIEKMMVDLNADSDEDSCYTITTITTPKSERSESACDSDQEATLPSEETRTESAETSDAKDIKTPAKENEVAASTPEKKELNAKETLTKEPNKDETISPKGETSPQKVPTTPSKVDKPPQKSQPTLQRVDYDTQEDKLSPSESVASKESPKKNIETPTNETKINTAPEKEMNINDEKVNMKNSDETSKTSNAVNNNSDQKRICTAEENALTWKKVTETQSVKEDSINFLQHERSQPRSLRTPKTEQKMGTKKLRKSFISLKKKLFKKSTANGRTVKSVPSKKKGGQTERRDMNSSKSTTGINMF